ncbi:hypothetical protein C2I06_15795 [Niallia circulans]|uniref:hypothetical protein n=1 Tax=Niallia circulans TaxID=1397 RepID=UPI000F44E052|nr:hypothetical protein [Niallia circulans]AYV68209.1 hypothetical protein C2I06_15795 [Niallia circulans]
MFTTLTSSFQEALEKIYHYIKETEIYAELNTEKECILFLSVGFKNKRADVINVTHQNFEWAWKTLVKQAIKYFGEAKDFCNIKVDWVNDRKTYSIIDFIEMITHTKKNYFRKGISFDSSFTYAFLEQELNSNSMIKLDGKTNRGYLDEVNIQHYISRHRMGLNKLDFNKVTAVTTFSTQGFYCDQYSCYTLKSDEYDNGRRDTKLDANELKQMIQSAQKQLINMCKPYGKFVYGYFSCFDKEIKFYNMLRHASTLYAMTESYELFPDPILKESIERGLDYLIDKAMYKDGQKAYIIDQIKEDTFEIKLGANAAAILALSKYLEIFGLNQHYLLAAQQLAKGIVELQQPDGKFIHVLHYPSLNVKEAYRIVYYDGEAAFALMRLYKLDKNPKWIECVEHAFNYFIANNYWKNHDHWLSYCTNELIKYKPEKKYFEFGLKNTNDKLDFIYHRKTTYPTFLELTMATYHMIQYLKKTNHASLLTSFDEKKLIDTIHRRAEYQRNGYFYPELAMYYKNPNRIKGGFFIRHHSFRMRIDDIEHYLSGYCQYFHTFLAN